MPGSVQITRSDICTNVGPIRVDVNVNPGGQLVARYTGTVGLPNGTSVLSLSPTGAVLFEPGAPTVMSLDLSVFVNSVSGPVACQNQNMTVDAASADVIGIR